MLTGYDAMVEKKYTAQRHSVAFVMKVPNPLTSYICRRRITHFETVLAPSRQSRTPWKRLSDLVAVVVAFYQPYLQF